LKDRGETSCKGAVWKKTARFGEDRGRGRFRDKESSYSKLSIEKLGRH